MHRQFFNIINPLPQWRYVNGNRAETKQKVISELTLFYHFRQIAITCRHQPEITFCFTGIADGTKAAFLQNPQKHLLHAKTQLPDFIEEKGSPVSMLY